MKKEIYIVLESLRLRNFKGVFEYTFTLDGISKNIFGANETGKSTFLTAFLWLLTGKDEFDRQDYEIKNTKRPELNRQGHEVEGVFRVNNDTITLKRVYLEKHVRPRGATKEEFKGHETEYYINDVLCSTAAEFKSRVEEIIPGTLLKLITNPIYFNSLHWEQQRRGLIDIAGEITDNEVINTIATPKEDFGTLIMLLNSGKKLDQHKAEIASKINTLKTASKEFKPRIDEAKHNKPEEKDWKAIATQLSRKNDDLEDIDKQLTDAGEASKKKYKDLTDKRNILFKKESELANIRHAIHSKIERERSELPNRISDLKAKVAGINNDIISTGKSIDGYKNNITAYHNEIGRLDQEISSHRENWNKINAERFEFDEAKCECPACKQRLPEDQIETKRDELLRNFNEDVKRRKDREVSQSNQRKAEKTQEEEKIEQAKKQIQILELKLADLQAQQSTLNNEIDAHVKEQNSKALDPIEVATDALLKVNADALNLQDEILPLKEQIEKDSGAASNDEDLVKLRESRKAIQEEINGLRDSLALKKVIEDTDNRIQQLSDEEQATAQQIATLEKQQFEVETFENAKMKITEERVNSKFKLVKFRLFDKQVNGQVIPSCVCEYKGVPFPTLNTAAKLQAGLDVLETLSNHYGIHAPVICDNRESVTWIPETKSQIISLFVSPQDTILRVEDAHPVKQAS